MTYIDGTVVAPTEAAIVTTNGCEGLSLIMPKYADEDILPRMILALTACFVRLEKDPTFLDEQIDWMNSQRDKIPG